MKHLVSTLALILAAGPALAEETNVLPTVTVSADGFSLTAPDTAAATEAIQRTPGAVAVVPAEAYAGTASATLKDVFDYTPGIFVQPKWGGDARLSIRGSGLSRNFHLRGVQLFQDGVPMIFADGSGDSQEIDPTAYDHVEVWKGGNGLALGANTTGGAINFVTPTGHGASPLSGRATLGSYGFRQLQLSSGKVSGPVDAHVTGSWVKDDGFRDHSEGEAFRGSANLGWRLADNAETRFHLNTSDINQYIPGGVTRDAALNNPKTAAAGNLAQDFQRNIQSVRFSNKTTVVLDETTLEFGAYISEKHLIHPISIFIDYKYRDQGLFGRAVDERQILGHDNRFTLGGTFADGRLDGSIYVNTGNAGRGNLLSQSTDRAETSSLYAENAFDLVPDVAFVVGAQYVWAVRDRDAISGTVDGRIEKTAFNPKVGLLWDVTPAWQFFANVSKATEMPSFGELNFTQAALSDTRPQKALTYEVGTRGGTIDHHWDIAIYHSRLRDEFLFEDLGGGLVAVSNADKTIHQGIEAGFGVTVAKGLFAAAADDRLVLNGAYTFSDFHFDGDARFGDNDLPGAPRHFLRAEVLYKTTSGLSFGPNVEWVPQGYHVDNANSEAAKTESYALLGFNAGWDATKGLNLFLEGRNLLDEHYIASASTAITVAPGATPSLYEPGSGRSLFVGANFAF